VKAAEPVWVVTIFFSGRNTAFTGFNAFFGAGLRKWRRDFSPIFSKSPV
jgi:hypothetical protein